MKPETSKAVKHAIAQKRYTLKQQERGAKRMCVWVPEGREVEFNLAIKKLKRGWTSRTD